MLQHISLCFIFLCFVLWAVYRSYPFLRLILRRSALRGPRALNFVFGTTKLLLNPRTDVVSQYESWARSYGSVYQIPAPFGSRIVVLCDPKAVAHFYSLETTVYGRHPVRREIMGKTVSISIPIFDVMSIVNTNYC